MRLSLLRRLFTVSHRADCAVAGCSYNPAPMRLIQTTNDLSQFCERLAQHDFVTVDTEFIREQTFWPKLCLIQLAGPDDEAIVDPLAPGIDLAPFYALMANERVVKVFHAARQDLEIVWTQARLIPHPIFDTQVAAMVCGFGESVSYVNLVKQVTGQDLDKTLALHRLGAPAADPEAADLCAGRRDPPARHLRAPEGGARGTGRRNGSTRRCPT